MLKQALFKPLRSWKLNLQAPTLFHLVRAISTQTSRKSILTSATKLEATTTTTTTILPYAALLRDINLQLLLVSDLRRKRPSSIEQSTLAAQNYELFVNAISMVTGSHGSIAYRFVLVLWRAIFFLPGCDEATKQKFIAHKDHVINIMINNGDYESYVTMVKPLLKPNREVSRAELVMETFQFQNDKTINRVLVSERALEFFKSGLFSLQTKHEVLAHYIRKAVLHFGNTVSPNEFFKLFIEYASAIQPFNKVFRPNSEFIHIYKKSLRMFLVNSRGGLSTHLQNLRRILLLHIDKKTFGDFLTCLMESTAIDEPQKTITVYEFKSTIYDGKKQILHTSADLKHVMTAYMQLKNYNKVLDIHSKNAKIQNESHIEILLQLSSKTKNWKDLQAKFESMYGKGDLPRSVHYTVVMKALVSMGAREEINRLMAQLKSRNLKPNVYMYKSLIQAALNEEDFDSVKSIFKDFFVLAKKGVVPQADVAKLLPLIIEAAALQPEFSKSINEAERILDEKVISEVSIINEETLTAAVTLASATYSMKLFEKAYETARTQNILSDQFYKASITFLTKMGLFERAEKLALEAHQKSDVPFQNALIFGSQLKNYRIWAVHTTDKVLQAELIQEARNLVELFHNGQMSLKNLDEFLFETAKFYLSVKEIEHAERFFKLVWKSPLVGERHYLPLLNFYCNLIEPDANVKIIDLYEKMVEAKIELTAKTFIYVVRALIDNDVSKKEDFGRSFRVLRSVLKMYDLMPEEANKTLELSSGDADRQNKIGSSSQYQTSDLLTANDKMLKTKPKSKTRALSKFPKYDLTRNASPLLQMLTYYIYMWLGKRGGTSTFALEVLDRIQHHMGNSVSVEFRTDFFYELARLYSVNRDTKNARAAINKAMAELNGIFATLPSNASLPRLLSIQYGKILELNFKILEDCNADVSEYERMFEEVINTNVQLERKHWDRHFKHVIHPRMKFELFEKIFSLCEQSLASGSMADVKLSRLISKVYFSYISFTAKSLSSNELEKKYGVLNRFYGVDIDELKLQISGKLHSELRDALQADLLKLPIGYQVSFETLILSPANLFVPGRLSWQNNYINPVSAARLSKLLDKFCFDDKNLAFELYEKYPETFEYLLIYREERFRLVALHEEIKRLGGEFNRKNRKETHLYIIKVIKYMIDHGF